MSRVLKCLSLDSTIKREKPFQELHFGPASRIVCLHPHRPVKSIHSKADFGFRRLGEVRLMSINKNTLARALTDEPATKSLKNWDFVHYDCSQY